MNKGVKTDDGYLFSCALGALNTLGNSGSDGWSQIREFWEALAREQIDDEDAARWAQEIAKRVVDNVLDADPLDRPRQALKALGLVGIEQDHRKEREYILMFEEFRSIAEQSSEGFKLSRRDFAQRMLNGGYFEGLEVEQAMHRIDYIKKTRSRKK